MERSCESARIRWRVSSLRIIVPRQHHDAARLGLFSRRSPASSSGERKLHARLDDLLRDLLGDYVRMRHWWRRRRPSFDASPDCRRRCRRPVVLDVNFRSRSASLRWCLLVRCRSPRAGVAMGRFGGRLNVSARVLKLHIVILLLLRERERERERERAARERERERESSCFVRNTEDERRQVAACRRGRRRHWTAACANTIPDDCGTRRRRRRRRSTQHAIATIILTYE